MAIVVTTTVMLRTRPKAIIVIDKEVDGIGAHSKTNDPLNCNSNSTTLIVEIESSLVKTTTLAVVETIDITSMGIRVRWEAQVNHSSNNARATKETTITTTISMTTSAVQQSTYNKMMVVSEAAYLPWLTVLVLASSWVMQVTSCSVLSLSSIVAQVDLAATLLACVRQQTASITSSLTSAPSITTLLISIKRAANSSISSSISPFASVRSRPMMARFSSLAVLRTPHKAVTMPMS